MKITQEQFDEAVLDTFSGENWEVIKQGLANEIYSVQSSVFLRDTWDDVVEDKGFARGLMYVIGLREQVIAAIRVEKENAHADV